MVARFPSSLICWPPSVCLPLSVSLAVFFKSVFLFPLQLRQRVHLVFRCNIIQKNAKHFQDIFLSSRFSVWVSVSVFLSVCLFIDGLFFCVTFLFPDASANVRVAFRCLWLFIRNEREAFLGRIHLSCLSRSIVLSVCLFMVYFWLLHESFCCVSLCSSCL